MAHFFGKKVDPSCSYCEHGNESAGTAMILCKKKGVVAPHYSCKKFIYSPLKRVPKRRRALPEYNREEFEL